MSNCLHMEGESLLYMGQGHPKRAQFEHELATMKKMLEQIDTAMGAFE